MATIYHLGRARRAVNAVMSPLARLGLAGRHTYNLTVRGRNTERSYTVPVIRPFFDVTPRSGLADFIAEAPRHPVFLLKARSAVDVLK